MENFAKIISAFISKLKNKKASVVTCGLLILTCLFAISIFQSKSAVKAKREELAAIEYECEVQLAENLALKELLENSDDEYIERKARDDLDYVLPGERVYIVRAGN